MYDEFHEIIEIISRIKGNVLIVANGSACNSFDGVVDIGNDLATIEELAGRLYGEAKRQKEMASKLRKEFGNQLSGLCDAAGLD